MESSHPAFTRAAHANTNIDHESPDVVNVIRCRLGNTVNPSRVVLIVQSNTILVLTNKRDAQLVQTTLLVAAFRPGR